jgi:hypothetical protein
MYKGEHFFKIDVIILFKFEKVNMEKFRGKQDPKNEVLKIERLERLKVRLYT